MSDFLMNWFEGFEKGIDSLGQKEKENFFNKCGSNCVDKGVIKMYQQLYIDSEKDFDIFFSKLNEFDSVSGSVVKSKKIYEIVFPQCVCRLHTLVYVNSVVSVNVLDRVLFIL